MSNIRRMFALVLCLSLFLPAASAQTAATPQAQAAAQASALPRDLDATVERAMREFEVPGLALAVVKDGKVLLAKGYGVRKMGDAARVDEHTLFGIASNTKAFTAAALAMLVDEGKLKWDDPATKHLPKLQLADAYVTRELTVRDMLSHRSGLGLGAGDLLSFPESRYTREQILERVRGVRPASSLRSRYAYNNVMFLAAGQVIPAITGKSWDEFVRERIFAPLGMSDTSTSVAALKPGGNWAIPHARVPHGAEKVRNEVIEPMNWDNMGPAGSINSNVVDLSKWAIAQLNRGEYAPGKRLFSERQSREMWAAQTITPISPAKGKLARLTPRFAAYGLGWGLRDFNGRKLVQHSGGLPGYISRVGLLPEENAAVIVLTNAEAGGAVNALYYLLLDQLTGTSGFDWIGAFRESEAEGFKQVAEHEREAQSKRLQNTRPSLPLGSYARDYQDAWYGQVNVAEEKGKLVIRFTQSPSLVGDLEHWHLDTFRLRWRDLTVPDAWLTFIVNKDAQVERIAMEAISPMADFSYDFQDLDLLPVKKEQGR